jgi:V/A-type H+-transporting ATPase subunit D
LHELRLERRSARLGRDLLDDKRESILRTLLERSPRLAAARERASEALRRAERWLHEGRVELGERAVDAAVLAQPVVASVDWRAGSVVGVPTPRLAARVPAFAPQYGPAATSATLDRAGADFSALVADLVAFGEEDEAVRNLQRGLTRTVRRLRALEEVLIPALEREARAVAVAVEEDERDDAVRHRQSGAFRRTSWPGEPNATR